MSQVGAHALVLGAGGHAAIAWEIGLVAGAADRGLDLRAADLFVGTSAGAVVGAQLASALPLEDLFQRQVDPRLQAPEPAPPVDFGRWRAEFLLAREGAHDPAAILKRFGALARRTAAERANVRRQMIEARVPAHEWPARRLLIAAVDVDSGERRAFDRDSGADLVDAVAASGAVPGIWPPVPIGGRSYMDGGVYSIDNADLAAGCAHVVIVTLPARVPPICIASLDSAVATLQRGGARVEVIHPDEASQAAFASAGGNLLDPSVREPAARAGREQGRRLRL